MPEMSILPRRAFLAGSIAATGALVLPGCATTGAYSFVEAIRRLLVLSSERAFARLASPGGYWDQQVAQVGLDRYFGNRGSVLGRILTSTLINLVALFMPGWVPLGPQKAKGAAAFGHNILLSMGLFLVSGIVLGGGALVVALVVLLQTSVLGVPVGTWELPLLGCIGALPAAGAAALGVRLGALLWADLDASREILDSAG